MKSPLRTICTQNNKRLRAENLQRHFSGSIERHRQANILSCLPQFLVFTASQNRIIHYNNYMECNSTKYRYCRSILGCYIQFSMQKTLSSPRHYYAEKCLKPCTSSRRATSSRQANQCIRNTKSKPKH